MVSQAEEEKGLKHTELDRVQHTSQHELHTTSWTTNYYSVTKEQLERNTLEVIDLKNSIVVLRVRTKIKIKKKDESLDLFWCYQFHKQANGSCDHPVSKRLITNRLLKRERKTMSLQKKEQIESVDKHRSEYEILKSEPRTWS